MLDASIDKEFLSGYATRRRMREERERGEEWKNGCVKDNIECHTEKQKGNPLIKAILFVIGDLFALPPRPTSSQGIWNIEKGMFGWVWLGGILTGLSIFAYRCQSAELGAAGVHKSSYAQLSKTHTNKRWRYSRREIKGRKDMETERYVWQIAGYTAGKRCGMLGGLLS